MLADTALLSGLSEPVLHDLRARLIAARFDDRVLAEAERIVPATFDAVRLPLVHWALRRRDDPPAALARLFVYGDRVADGAVRTILGPSALDALLAAGVVTAEHGELRAAYRLMPFDDGWVLSDEPEGGAEAVMGPGPTTLALARALAPALSGAGLDVGCGAGSLALALARRGARPVVATDISERAIAIARVNARLNGLELDLRTGDLLAPVRGARASVVVAQPPFVVRPAGVAPVTYLHGGPTGDEIALRLIAGLPEVLAPGGRALVLLESPTRPRAPLCDRLRAVLGPAAVDLVVLAAPGAPPDLQAIAYATVERPDLGPGYAEAVQRYRDHLEATGLREFTRALVIVSRTPPDRRGRNLTASLPVRSLRGLDHAALEARLAGLALAASDDSVLEGAALRAARGGRWAEERPSPDLAADPARFLRFPDDSTVADRELSEASWVLVGALDHAASVADGVAAFARLCEAEPREVRDQVLRFARDALADGLLEPRRRAAGEPDATPPISSG